MRRFSLHLHQTSLEAYVVSVFLLFRESYTDSGMRTKMGTVLSQNIVRKILTSAILASTPSSILMLFLFFGGNLQIRLGFNERSSLRMSSLAIYLARDDAASC